MGTRDDVAAALGAVPGLTGHPYVPDVVTPGDAWPAWVANDPILSLGCAEPGMDEWQVFVALGTGSPATTAGSLTAWLAPVMAALATCGRIGRAQIANVITADSVTVPALTITLFTDPER